MDQQSSMGAVAIKLSGRIDSSNAPSVEKEVLSQLEGKGAIPVVINAEALEYISSAGLRVLLRVKKNYPNLKITGVNPEVYDILEMTGFTEMMTVEKAYRVVSVEGCEEIGRGANGTIYRIDKDNVVKVYNNADALSDIQQEREVARLALILGVPTAISYDVVRVGDSYGSVFELLNAQSFSKIIATQPDKFDWCVKEYVAMLKKIHSTVVPHGKLPDMRETALKWAKFMQDYLPEEAGRKLLSLVEAVPPDDHMLHGDYHTKNLELQDDEVLLIDMDTLAVGHPIFELASMFNSFVGYSELNHDVILNFQGFDFETGKKFWHSVLAAYLGTDNESKIKSVEDKARIVGYTRMIRRSIRRKGLETAAGKAEIDFWTEQLVDLLTKTDTLLFDRSEIEVDAIPENLEKVQAFVERELEGVDCSPRTMMQFSVAVEEVFVNIANYAYVPDQGTAIIRMDVSGEPPVATITFIDRGIPYNPLAKPDPDVTLSADEREIGGLGVYLTKKAMDNVSYAYEDGQNILTLRKKI